MIQFVAYFSTAQDALGYVIQDGHGIIDAEFLGGPILPEGIYRVEQGGLVLVEEGTLDAEENAPIAHAAVGDAVHFS